ncbi:MAG TPA: GTP cyclohydrolase FolE2 [Burkholderiaceae bacterium]|nr:GTP cyclohydrolase FolE2 [Burkholderiaceae bacterium]
MNAPDSLYLPDVQSAGDLRNLAIQRVGVKSLTHPMMVATARGPQPTVASVDMFVALPPQQKGTHMSRFIDVLQSHREPLSRASVHALLERMLQKLDAIDGTIDLRLPYFVLKTAPVSGVESLMDYQLALAIERRGSATRYRQTVVVPVTSLCPCSKKVADYGAHNQRAHLTLALVLEADMPVEEQIRIAEDASSCEIWGLLKRTDEKYVTERAYDNPKFVEDVVRDVAVVLDADPRVCSYTVEAENFESIHNHSAYALIERDKGQAA